MTQELLSTGRISSFRWTWNVFTEVSAVVERLYTACKQYQIRTVLYHLSNSMGQPKKKYNKNAAWIKQVEKKTERKREKAEIDTALW